MRFLINCLITATILLIPSIGDAQMNKQIVSTSTSVLAIGFSGGVYTIQCNFISFQAYSSGSVQVGDTYSVEYALSTPKATVRFDIESVTPVSGSRIELELRPLDGATLITFPSNNGTIYRQTTNLDLGLIEANTSDFLKAGLLNHNFIVLDSAINAVVAPTGRDTSLGTFDQFLDESRIVDGEYGTADITWDSISHTFTGDDYSFTAFDEFSVVADSVRLNGSDGGIMLHTPGIEAGDRQVGFFYVLLDKATGRGEWDSVAKYLPADTKDRKSVV